MLVRDTSLLCLVVGLRCCRLVASVTCGVAGIWLLVVATRFRGVAPGVCACCLLC